MPDRAVQRHKQGAEGRGHIRHRVRSIGARGQVRPHSDLDHHGSATQSHGIGGGLIEPHLSLIAAGGRFPIRTHFDGKK
jgi:hypothetical protein